MVVKKVVAADAEGLKLRPAEPNPKPEPEPELSLKVKVSYRESTDCMLHTSEAGQATSTPQFPLPLRRLGYRRRLDQKSSSHGEPIDERRDTGHRYCIFVDR